MKKTKRFVSLTLATTMILGMFTFVGYAEQTKETKYWVTVGEHPTDGSGGVIHGEDQYFPGEEVTITVEPSIENGYCSAQWVGTDIGLSHTPAHQGKTSHTFTMPEKAVQISISFAEHRFDIVSGDLEDGTHDGVCLQCGEFEGKPSHHEDKLGAGDSQEPDGYCDDCGADMHTHDFSVIENNKTYHWYECTCGEIDNDTKTAHEYVDGVCSVCEYEKPEEKPEEEPEHTHNFPTEWISNASGHWHECECGKKSNRENHSYSLKKTNNDETHTLACECGFEKIEECENRDADCEEKKEECTVCGGYCAVQSIKHEGPFVDTTTGNFYVNTEHADDIKTLKCEACGEYVTSSPRAIPVFIGGVEYDISIAEGTAFIVEREDIANGSISEIDMTPITGTTTLTEEQAKELIDELLASYVLDEEVFKSFVISELADYSLDEIKLIRKNIKNDEIRKGVLIDIIDEEIESREATALVIAPGYIDANTDKFTVNFGGTQAEMNNDALQKILNNLGDGDNVKISVKDVGAEVLPKTLTEKGPYGGSEAAIDKSIFKATGIENIEDRLKTLGLINGNTDSSVTEDEFKYLYHYLTTNELTALKNELNESAHFEHHQNAVNWLTEMIERDATVVEMNSGQLDNLDIRSKLEEIGYTGSGLTLGLLRQADLDMEQLEYIKNLMQEFIEAFDDDADELILAWANEAIAQKKLEATCVQMNALLEEARSTQGSYTGLDDVKAAVKNMTIRELKLFMEKAKAAKNNESGTLPVLALSAIDSIIEFLNSELKSREASDTPTYINTDGTSDGINPLFIGAVDINIGAVKVDGTTTPIAIKADRSDAVAWSMKVDSAWLEEKVAEMKNTTGANAAVRAYKVLDNGGLEAKAVKVTENADGTLTASALSNGNSTYVFLLMPDSETPDNIEQQEWQNPFTDVKETNWFYEAVKNVNIRGIMNGTTETTFAPNDKVNRAMFVTVLYRMEGSPEAGTSKFSDVKSDAYYAKAVAWASANGIVNGVSETEFAPNANITREQIAAILYRYAQFKKYDVSVGENTNILSYTDFDSISEYAIEALQYAAGSGIIKGKTESTLNPKDNATRAEMATMIIRFSEK